MENRNDAQALAARKQTISDTLRKILSSTDKLGPDRFLLDKYVSYISSITDETPTADLANFGMKLMYDIAMEISADTQNRSWLPDIAAKTCAYFRFAEK